MRALFGRKVSHLKELQELTQRAVENGQKGQPYTIIKEVKLQGKDFREFAKDFFEDQDWITRDDCGTDQDGKIRCIRVENTDTGERVLVNTEGYDYPRYTALG